MSTVTPAPPYRNHHRDRGLARLPDDIVLLVSEHSPWADSSFLRNVQYRTDSNLAARQSIYRYQQPKIEFPKNVIEALELTGSELAADVGCGNGAYLAALAERGHQGALLGIDMSPGMLAAARSRAPGARLLAGDAAALPLRSATADLTLAMHMLYHVPEPPQAVAELRRVTRPGGSVVVALNADDHLLELRALINDVLDGEGHASSRAVDLLRLDDGEELLAGYFDSVTRIDFQGTLMVPGPEPVADYIRSMTIAQLLGDEDRLVQAVTSRVDFADGGCFRVTTHAGCLICR